MNINIQVRVDGGASFDVEQSNHRVVGGKCIAVSNTTNKINGTALLLHRHQGHHHNHDSH